MRAHQRGPVFLHAGIAFIHIPRSAGTSVTDALYGRFIGHFTVRQLMWVGGAQVLALPRFTIVRNPWDRLVSAYEFVRAGAGLNGPSVVQVAHAERYQTKAFASFERFVEEYLNTHDPLGMDGVFRPQTYYALNNAGDAPFSHIGRFENISETASWLSETLGRDIALPHFNATLRNDYRTYYTPHLRDLVARIYARDIAAFNYDF